MEKNPALAELLTAQQQTSAAQQVINAQIQIAQLEAVTAVRDLLAKPNVTTLITALQAQLPNLVDGLEGELGGLIASLEGRRAYFDQEAARIGAVAESLAEQSAPAAD